MECKDVARWRTVSVASIATVCASWLGAGSGASFAAETASGAADNDSRGYVVSHIAYALSKDAAATGACPDGLSTGYSKVGDVYVSGPDAPAIPNAAEEATLEHTLRLVRTPKLQNYCQNPELGKPDPNWHTVKGVNVPVEGIDLDGQDSTARGKAAPNTCAHDDFPGLNGAH